jgi:hypothetical protein
MKAVQMVFLGPIAEESIGCPVGNFLDVGADFGTFIPFSDLGVLGPLLLVDHYFMIV